jgi:hypothetical protein
MDYFEDDDMEIHEESMDSNTLHVLRCQFLYHIWNCETCRKRGLLPDHLCKEATKMHGEILAWSEIEDDYRREHNEINIWKEAEQKQMISPLISFWPGTN